MATDRFTFSQSQVNERLWHIHDSEQGGAEIAMLTADSIETINLIDKCMNARAAAATLGAKGGKVKTEAKQLASRTNGKLGGRPRKAQTDPA